jgi:hypothetical protein
MVSKKIKQASWTVSIHGDCMEYADPIDPAKKVSNAVLVVRSLLWPGAYTVFCKGRQISFYLGCGHKYEQVKYYPVHPPVVLADPKEEKESPEPTPLHEPVKDENNDDNKDGSQKGSDDEDA